MPSAKCLEVLSQLTDTIQSETCTNRKIKARLALCRARQLQETEKLDYSQSLRQAWKEIKAKCKP